MDPELLTLLRCPSCHEGPLSPVHADGDALACAACGRSFKVREELPVLVPESSPLSSSIESELPPLRSGLDTNATRQRMYWESDLRHRAADHPVVEGFARQRWRHLEALLPLTALRSALDVGAGNGFSTRYAPEHLEVTATDGSFRMLSGHSGKRRLLADAKALPFRDKVFDLAYCWELLHHVDEPHVVLREMARVARKYVYVFEPNPLNVAQAAFALLDTEHRWVLRYSRGYLRREFERAGLEPIAHENVGLIFPNKTPASVYPLLKRLPFRLPYIGISHLVVARVLN
jgi:SAM-dependent methyltransferase/uncharacterized protein YbaR (Trm112 family)